MESYDAVIIGAGPNALVSAAYLTKAGWSCLILDRNDRPGGGLRTDAITLPGFQHDVYAGFLVLFAISQAYADLGKELTERGLTMANSGTPAAVSMHGGKAALLTTDMQANMAEADRLAPGDGAAWAQMLQNLGQRAPQVFTLLKSDLTSPEAGELMRQLFMAPDGQGFSSFASEFFLTARDVLETTFKSDIWRGLLAPWVLHSGHGPDEANSGFWVQVFGMGAQSAGLPVGVGGAEKMASALAQLIKDQGGKIVSNTTASRILVENGKAVGVRTEAGEEFRANRAILATVNPDQLYLKLLAGVEGIPAELPEQARNYRYGHAVMAIHLALSEPPHWHDPRLDKVTYTHVTAGLDGVSRNFNETTRRLLPADPTIGVGTPTTLDPSRAPEGKAVMVLQALDTPFMVTGDAAGKVDVGNGTWTEDLKNRYADRVIDIVGQHIPNLKSAILARNIISPLDLANANLNWNNGDPYAGSHAIAQSYAMRPIPGQPRHRTPVANLYQIGAATHPGLGLAGGSGYVVAQMLLSGVER
jgi:phytoene dehydrogenase-like protein